MENLLHYVWKFRLYDPACLCTTEGLPLEVLDPGVQNMHAGPDYFNAKIKIKERVWVGNVEIHTYTSGWLRHGHHTDKAYNSVILHVAGNPDIGKTITQSNRQVPVLILPVPERVKEDFRYLLNTDRSPACLDLIRTIPPVYVRDWMSALWFERLERKVEDIAKLLEEYEGSWNDVFYIILARNFGFGVNNDAFERLAKSLPLKYILKHKNSSWQVESLFFGQAGLLEEDGYNKDDYYRKLKTEYTFLKCKFNLKPLQSYLFKKLRIRPANFPHVKISQLAELVRTQDTVFSRMLDAGDINSFRKLFAAGVSAYWQGHYNFCKPSAVSRKYPGRTALDLILVNTVIPFLFSYGSIKKQEVYIHRALELAEQLTPENNYIVTCFKKAGILPLHAGDTQALVQLYKEYCEKKKCIFCRIGHKLLSK